MKIAILAIGLVSLTSIAQQQTNQAVPPMPANKRHIGGPPPQTGVAAPVNNPTEPNIVKLSDAEKQEITTMQRDIEDAEVQAFQMKSKIDEQNKEIERQAKVLNDRLAALRVQHKLSPDAFFNQKEDYFVVPPAPTPPEKK